MVGCILFYSSFTVKIFKKLYPVSSWSSTKRIMVIVSGGTHNVFCFIDYISILVFIKSPHEYIFLLNDREKRNNKHCLKHTNMKRYKQTGKSCVSRKDKIIIPAIYKEVSSVKKSHSDTQPGKKASTLRSHKPAQPTRCANK